ncbi:MAG: hypothetical protein R3B59_09175 [Dehalococcoidia bacterium]
MPCATRVTVAAIGTLVAYAGIEHGIGEIRQGFGAPDSIAFESWPDTRGFEALGGEPAMSVIPSLALTGLLAIVVSLAVAIWSLRFVQRRHGGSVLVGLSLLLLLVGGGFGPPLIGVLAGVTATRMTHGPRPGPGVPTRVLARAWPWSLVTCLLAYLALVPGVVLLTAFTDFEHAAAVSALIAFAFSTLLLALVSARATDRLRAAPAPRPPAPP